MLVIVGQARFRSIDKRVNLNKISYDHEKMILVMIILQRDLVLDRWRKIEGIKIAKVVEIAIFRVTS
jgi:hypothetical protein